MTAFSDVIGYVSLPRAWLYVSLSWLAIQTVELVVRIALFEALLCLFFYSLYSVSYESLLKNPVPVQQKSFCFPGFLRKTPHIL